VFNCSDGGVERADGEFAAATASDGDKDADKLYMCTISYFYDFL